MDRFASYLPGWEMPKNSSDFLTSNYGFITDYLAEAFHYQLKHTNRYEEVSKRIRLGKAVEGRDEKGIKKTVSALLKILHPGNKPTDEEFDEYVSYAVESRRRIKEQMNKRKSDDEFSKINLSFFDKDGSEVVVFCPESKTALATQEPTRRDIHENGETSEIPDAVITVPAEAAPVAVTEVKDVEITTKAEPLPSEQHFTIYYGDTGHSYESLIAPYLNGAKAVEIEDPYIRATHQVHNFVRFCEAVIKTPTVRKIVLITSYDNDTDVQALSERLSELKQSLLDVDIELDIQINEHMHDREIRIDNGWTVKIGRGLDFYQKPDSWFGIGSNDLLLRKCLETKVDIFQR